MYYPSQCIQKMCLQINVIINGANKNYVPHWSESFERFVNDDLILNPGINTDLETTAPAPSTDVFILAPNI